MQVREQVLCFLNNYSRFFIDDNNQILYNKDGVEICRVNIDGNVYDSSEVLSIHKMSAKYLKKKNNNGWD